jgi:hypothetical protein
MHAKRPEDSCIHFGAGTAVQLDLFCSASHSMEPGAHVGGARPDVASRSACSCSYGFVTATLTSTKREARTRQASCRCDGDRFRPGAQRGVPRAPDRPGPGEAHTRVLAGEELIHSLDYREAEPYRRVAPIPVCRGEGRLTQSTAGLQPEKRELALVPPHRTLARLGMKGGTGWICVIR